MIFKNNRDRKSRDTVSLSSFLLVEIVLIFCKICVSALTKIAKSREPVR
jgi:hypothetical protein